MILHDDVQSKKLRNRLTALFTDPSPTAVSDVIRTVDSSPDTVRREVIAALEERARSGDASREVVDVLIALRRT